MTKGFRQGQAFSEQINTAAIRMIRSAAAKVVTVVITYTDSKGETTTRETEPYELKDGKYWGFDVAKGEIRQFRFGGISRAQVTTKSFQPRWPVQIAGEGV